jgi:hypothetical protein
MTVNHGPELAQKTVSTGYTIVAPLQSLLWGRCEHGKQAHCVCAVLVFSGLWIYTVVLRFRHLSDAATDDFFSGARLNCLEGFAFGIALNSDFIGVQPLFAAAIVFLKRLSQDHALIEQGFERFIAVN